MVLTGLDARFRKGRFVLNNSKQKHKKFLNFHRNSFENEINVSKSGVTPSSAVAYVIPWFFFVNQGCYIHVHLDE